MSVLIEYAQMPLLNTHSEVPMEAEDPKFGLSLHQHPYFVSVSSKAQDSPELVRSSVLVADALSTEISRTGSYYMGLAARNPHAQIH